MKRLIGYLFYTLLVGVIVYWGVKYGQYLKIQAGRTFILYPVYIFIAIYPIVVGMVLAVPGFISRIRQEGKWTIDWQMLLPIGLPTLLFNINPLLNNNSTLFKYGWYQLIVSDTRVFDISGIVCGYIILSSLVNTTSNNKKDIASGETRISDADKSVDAVTHHGGST